MTRSKRGPVRVRLSDVACAASVSTATVSRSLNEPEKVSPAIRLRVQQAARQLGWIPNAAGRALASNRSHIVGIVIPTLDDTIFASQVAGMQAVLADHAMTLLIACSNYDPEEGFRQVRAMLARGVEAIAIVGETHPPQLFDLLHAQGTPYVVTLRWRLGGAHPAIGFDNHAAFFRITEHLLGLGHRRFGAIFLPSRDNDRVRDRIAGMRDALERHGGTLAPGCFIEAESGIDAGRRGLDAILSASPERPTAVICGNDHLAVGALLQAADRGIAVPAELSVTGFDDIELAGQLRPALTTMMVDTALVGRVAAAYIIARINGTPPPPLDPITPVFHARASTAPPIGSGPGTGRRAVRRSSKGEAP